MLPTSLAIELISADPETTLLTLSIRDVSSGSCFIFNAGIENIEHVSGTLHTDNLSFRRKPSMGELRIDSMGRLSLTFFASDKLVAVFFASDKVDAKDVRLLAAFEWGVSAFNWVLLASGLKKDGWLG